MPLSGAGACDKSTADKGRQDIKAKRHACITTFEGLQALAEHQTKQGVYAKNGNKIDDLAAAKAAADTVSFDFDVMDGLNGVIQDSGYKIYKRAAK
jgi:hypothetical protein